MERAWEKSFPEGNLELTLKKQPIKIIKGRSMPGLGRTANTVRECRQKEKENRSIGI